jgi:glycerol transport system ATP-binding protein
MRLSAVGCDFEAGTFNVVLGRNGSGKTRLARRLAGLDIDPAVHIDGRAVSPRDTAIVFQEFINYPSLSVRSNIASPLVARAVPPREIEARVQSIARRLHIDELLERRPAELSGGQQQRVAIARALAKDASVLVLDEPLGNLDYKLREELIDELGAHLARSARVLVYLTADPREALSLADHLVLLDRGRVLQSGGRQEVWLRPSSPAAADLLSDPGVNFARARRRGDELELDGAIRASASSHFLERDREILLGIRPEHLRIARRDADLCIPGRVSLAETNGSDTFLHVEVGKLVWVAHVEGIRRFDEGAAIELFASPTDALRFELDA